MPAQSIRSRGQPAPGLPIGPSEAPPDVLASAPVGLIEVLGRNDAALPSQPGGLEGGSGGSCFDTAVVRADGTPSSADGTPTLAEPGDEAPLADLGSARADEGPKLPGANAGCDVRRSRLDEREAECVPYSGNGRRAIAVAHACDGREEANCDRESIHFTNARAAALVDNPRPRISVS
jgi:hypothetical protein